MAVDLVALAGFLAFAAIWTLPVPWLARRWRISPKAAPYALAGWGFAGAGHAWMFFADGAPDQLPVFLLVQGWAMVLFVLAYAIHWREGQAQRAALGRVEQSEFSVPR